MGGGREGKGRRRREREREIKSTGREENEGGESGEP